jgi:hypothetical protein
MAQYGLYNTRDRVPANKWEADSMIQNGEYVYLYVKGHDGANEQVAAIKLDKGQSVARVDTVR